MRFRRKLAVVGGLAAGAQWVPSVVSLGQWSPLRVLPGGWCRWRGAGPRVALTFDDGPSPDGTPAVLDALDRLGMRATFFCSGVNVERWPDLVREVVTRGHVVGTHGHRHAHHLGRSPRWVRSDLDAALATLTGVGIHPRWFRPPYGQVSGPTMMAARARGLQLVLWSAWGREWTSPDAASVARRVDAAVAPGAIILLHDSDECSPPGSAARALEALGPIAEGLARRGLEPVTLDELCCS